MGSIGAIKQKEFAMFMRGLGYEEVLPSPDEVILSKLRSEIVQKCKDDENCKKQEFLELVKNFRELEQLSSEQRDQLIMQLLALWLELDLTVAKIQKELEDLKRTIGSPEESFQVDKTDNKPVPTSLNPFFDKTVLEKLDGDEISPKEVLMYAVDVVLSKPEYQQAFVKMVQNPELVKACEGKINCVLENALLAGFANKDGSANNNYIAVEKALRKLDVKEKEEILGMLYESVAIANAVDDIMEAYIKSLTQQEGQTDIDDLDWDEIFKKEGTIGVVKRTYEVVQDWIKEGLKWTGLKDANAQKWSQWISLGGVVLGAWFALQKVIRPAVKKGWAKFWSLHWAAKIGVVGGLLLGKDIANDRGVTDWFKTLLFGEEGADMEIEESSPEKDIFYLDSVIVAILPSDKSLEELKREGLIIYNSSTKRYEISWDMIKDHPLVQTLLKSRYKGNEEVFKRDLNQTINSLMKVVDQNGYLGKRSKLKDIVAQKWRMAAELKMMISPNQWSRLKEIGKSAQVHAIILEFERGEITFEQAKARIQKLLEELGDDEGGNGDNKTPPSSGGGSITFDSTIAAGTAGAAAGAVIGPATSSQDLSDETVTNAGGEENSPQTTLKSPFQDSKDTRDEYSQTSASPSNQDKASISKQKQQEKEQGGDVTAEATSEKLDKTYEALASYLDDLLNKCKCDDKDKLKFWASFYVFIPFLQGQINEEQAKTALEELVFSTQADYMYLSQGDLNSLVYSLQSPDFMDFDYVSVDPTLKDESPLPISVIAQLEKLDESGELNRELNISLIYSQTINVVLENFGQHLLEDGKYKKKLSELKTVKKELYQATDGLLEAIGGKDANKIQQNLTKVKDVFKKYNEKLKNIALYVVFHSTLDSEKKYYLGVEFLKKLTEQKEVSPSDWLKVVEILDNLQYGLLYTSSLVETSLLSPPDFEENENTELQQEQKNIVNYLDKVACQRYGEGCENIKIDKTLSDLNEVPESVISYVERNVKFMGFSLTELVESGVVTKYTIKAAIVKGFPEVWKFFKELKTANKDELKWSDLEDEEKIALFESILGSRTAVEIVKSAMRNTKRKEAFFALIDSKYLSHEAQVLKSYFEWLYQKIKSKEHGDAWNIVKSLAGMAILTAVGRVVGAVAGAAGGTAVVLASRFNKIDRLASAVAQFIRWEKWGQYGKMFLNARNMGYAASFTYLNEPVQYALERDFGKSWEALKKSFSREYGLDYFEDFLGETAFFGLLEAAYPLATWMAKGLNRGQRVAKNAGALFIGGVGYTGINFIVDGEPPSFEEALNAAMILLLLGRMGVLPEAREGLTLRFTNGEFFIKKEKLKEWIDLHKNYVLNTNGLVEIKNVELKRVSASNSFDKVNLLVKSEKNGFNIYDGKGKFLGGTKEIKYLLEEEFWTKTIGMFEPEAEKVVAQMRRLFDMGDTSIASAILKGEKGLKGSSSVVIKEGGRNIEVPREFQGLGGKYKFERIDPNTDQRVAKEFSLKEVFEKAPNGSSDIEKEILRTMRGTSGKGIRLNLPKGATGLTKAEVNRRIELAKNGEIEEIFEIGGKNVKLEIEKGGKKLKFRIQKTSSSGTAFREDVSLDQLRKELGDKEYLEFIERLKNRSITRGLLKEGDYVRLKAISGETIELRRTKSGKVEVKDGKRTKTFEDEKEALRYLREEGKGLSIVRAYLEKINSLDKSVWDTLSPTAKKALSWAKDKLKITWRKLLQMTKDNWKGIANVAALASIPIGDRYLGGGLEGGSDHFGILAGGFGALLAPAGKRILTFFVIYSIVQGVAAWRERNQEHPAD